MKNVKLILIFLVFFTAGLAQGRRDRVEAMRVAYINKHAGLTEGEAEKFWPVYDEYHFKLRSAKKQLRQLYLRYNDQSGDEAVKQICATEQQYRKSELEIHTTYSEKIVALIGQRKYLRLRVAEEGFRRELLKTIRDRAGQED